MKLATSFTDLITEDLVDVIYPKVFFQVLNLDRSGTDSSNAQNLMEILSNILTYLDAESLANNMTGSWNRTNNTMTLHEKRDWMALKLNHTITIAKMIADATKYQLSFINTQIQVQTKTLSYR